MTCCAMLCCQCELGAEQLCHSVSPCPYGPPGVCEMLLSRWLGVLCCAPLSCQHAKAADSCSRNLRKRLLAGCCLGKCNNAHQG